MILLKLPLAILMIAMIAGGIYVGGIIGFLATVGMTVVLSMMIGRWERNLTERRRRSKQP
ncbi:MULTISPECIES: hypothetical protein [Aeromonas]|uniref:hypothetical protein n=1 Tax=Aeromonas TaxID=642 RepID=UPI00051ADBD0|nr:MULTISPECIES: hypothetical protein [Aeromonas]MBV7439059.1 hypothetical protein [Aeromonas sp. sif2416]